MTKQRENGGAAPPKREETSLNGQGSPRAGGSSPSNGMQDWKVPASVEDARAQLSTMFGHMLERQSFVDIRRRAITLIDVVTERQNNGPFQKRRLFGAFGCAMVYRTVVFPLCRDWGRRGDDEDFGGRAGGPWADLSWQWAALLTVGYLVAIFVGVQVMSSRPPVSQSVFEYMFVHNVMHLMVNAALGWSLVAEAWRLGFAQPWGNSLDPSPAGNGLGMLLWCTYHYKQLELFDTVFVILRKKFQRMSFLHVYLRLAQMWGWFFACRYACGGDAYFPAAVNSFCQVIVYLFYAISMMNETGIPLVRKARVTEVQVLQFAICATHASYVLAFGNMPRAVAVCSLAVALSGLLLYVEWKKGHQPRVHPRNELTIFGHMFAKKQSLTDLRRRSLTLIDVVMERQGNGPLMPHRLLGAFAVALLYWYYVLPACRDWGTGRWYREGTDGSAYVRAGGPWAEVSWAFPVLVTLLYVFGINAGMRIMERRGPAQKRVFEYMFIYNAVQVLFNALLSFNLLREAWRLGFSRPWGNALDFSAAGHDLGMLVWFQYHCRQLELLDTVFVLLRKKFNRMSGLHIFLRLAHMWGWFFVCRFAAGGDSYFPAAVNSTCQVIVYGYYAVSLINAQGVPLVRKAWVAEVQVLQFVLCASHACYVLYCGNLPRPVAALSLFIMGASLALFTDFTGDTPKLGVPGEAEQDCKKLTFRFDSSAWFYVYHFGVAKYIEEHMLPEGLTNEEVASDKYPKNIAFAGSSGGGLVAAALASGVNIRDLMEFVLSQHPRCRRAPWRLFKAVEDAMDKFLPENSAKCMSGRVRLLLTRVSLKPPFFTGDVVDQYGDWSDVFHGLRATCHVPGLNPFPYRYHGRYYFDGLVWSSLLVPWSGEDADLVVKVSAVGAPLMDIRAPMSPIWWAMLPPDLDEMRGMFWVGYQDAARWFAGPTSDLGLCRCRVPRERPRPAPTASAGAASSKASSKDNKSSRQKASGDRGAEETQGDSSSGECNSETTADPLSTSRVRKHAMARSLLLKQPAPVGKELPELDPVTGQRVQDLIRCYRRGIDEGFRRALWATLVVAGLSSAVAWAVAF